MGTRETLKMKTAKKHNYTEVLIEISHHFDGIVLPRKQPHEHNFSSFNPNGFGGRAQILKCLFDGT